MIWKRLLHAESSSIASAASVIAFFSILSRVVGFVRDRILSGAFGAGDTLDIYFAAFRIPDFLFNLLVVGALSASFIPFFSRFLAKKDLPGAWRHTNNILSITTGAFLLLSLLACVFAHQLAVFVAPGFDAEKQSQVADLSRIMFGAQVLLAFSVVYGSVLQATKRFVLYSLAPIFYNVGIIAGVFLFVPRLGIQGLAWGVALGALFHLMLQYMGVHALGYRYRPVLDVRDPDVRATFVQMVPRMIGLAVNQLNVIAMTNIASLLASGSVTLLQFAYNLNFFALGAVAVPYSIAAYPTFCAAFANKDEKAFTQSFSSTVRQLLFFVIPATVVMILLRAQIVRVVLGARKFTWEATGMTADALGLFAISLVAQSLVYVLVRAFFARNDTKTPLVVGVASVLVNVGAALVLSPDYGVAGLGIAYSLSAIIQVALLWIPLRLKVGSLDEGRIIRALGLFSFAAAGCAVATQGMKVLAVKVLTLDTFFGIFLQGLIAGVVGLCVYVAIAYALGSEEVRDFVQGLRLRLLQKAKPTEAIVTETATS